MGFLTYIKLDGRAKYSAGEFSLRTDVRTQGCNNWEGMPVGEVIPGVFIVTNGFIMCPTVVITQFATRNAH